MPTQELAAYDPTTVGPYRLRSRLGSGGMGVVYLADAPDGGPVAVKCLPPGVGGAVRVRLGREADYLSAVRHRRVAAFVDADVRAERPWIAMQYIAGPSLAQAAVPLGPAQVRHLADGLAEALAALHRQRLTHRDVKPGNIILTHAGPVLVDLGIASGGDLTSLTEVGMVVGTPEWMSPEQLTGHPTGPPTDVWGWACVLAYAATGRTPFGGGAIEALAYRIRHEPPDLRGVPAWLRGAVAAGLAKDGRSRPTAAQLAVPGGIERTRPVVAPPLRPGAAPAAAGSRLVPPRVPPPGAPPRAAPPPVVPPHAGEYRAAPPAAPRRTSTSRAPAPPGLRSDRPLPPGARRDRRAAARRAKAARRAERARPAPGPPARRPDQPPVRRPDLAPPVRRPDPPPEPRRPDLAPRAVGPVAAVAHRSFRSRLRRALVMLLVVAVAAVVVGVGAYVCVWHIAHGGSWGQPLRQVRDRILHG